jgi:hypothetical protein
MPKGIPKNRYVKRSGQYILSMWRCEGLLMIGCLPTEFFSGSIQGPLDALDVGVFMARKDFNAETKKMETSWLIVGMGINNGPIRAMPHVKPSLAWQVNDATMGHMVCSEVTAAYKAFCELRVDDDSYPDDANEPSLVDVDDKTLAAAQGAMRRDEGAVRQSLQELRDLTKT